MTSSASAALPPRSSPSRSTAIPDSPSGGGSAAPVPAAKCWPSSRRSSLVKMASLPMATPASFIPIS